MLKDTRYVILRSQEILVPTTDNLGVRRGANTFALDPEQMQIEATQLSLSERNDLRRDPRTMAIACRGDTIEAKSLWDLGLS